MLDPKLVAKYWEGETSLDEERLLRAQAKHDTSGDAVYFRQLNDLQNMRTSLKASSITGESSTVVVRPLSRLVAAAAAALLIIVSGIGLFQYSKVIEQPVAVKEESFETPEEALEEVKLALAFVSEKLNRSQSTAYSQIHKAGQYAEWFN